jgi:DNA helicase TIP49 (TBP-interacting protein)|tara:strand:+ start:174 stop:476 length:303 start_codon:yes stop_codon:yes gene_type:complete
MPFSKSFPKQSKTSTYPQWEEVFLTEEEEKQVSQKLKEENIKLFKDCIDDAKSIIQEKGIKDYQTDLINIAVSLFEKRASHEVYWKENKAKEKFDEMFNK